MAPKSTGITADVAFDSAEDMQWAIETHNGITKIRGHKLTLKPSAKDPCAAVVGNLPADIDGDELSVLFEDVGDGKETIEDVGDGEETVEDVGDGEETIEATEPPTKKAKTVKTPVKKTSAAAADNSDEDDASAPSEIADKTFEVRFADASNAAKAVKKLHDTWWDDTTQVRVRLDDTGEKIFLRVAAASVTWQDVKAFCGSIGSVVFAGEKGKGKGKGEVKGKGKGTGGKPVPPVDSDSSGDEGGKSKSKGARKGSFTVKYYDPKHAKKAVKRLHDAWWDDKTQAKVEVDPECWDGASVTVQIVATGLQWSNIKEWCEQIGPVIFAKDMAQDKGKGKGKGKPWGKPSTGYTGGKPSTGEFEVRYESAKHAAKCAKKLNGAWWDDKTQAWVEHISEDKCIVYLDDPSIRWHDVKDWASTVGTVVFCGAKGKGKGKSADEW